MKPWRATNAFADKSELDDFEDSSGGGTGSGGGNSHDGSSTGQSSNRSSGNGTTADDQDNLFFANRENMNVKRLKFLVIFNSKPRL